MRFKPLADIRAIKTLSDARAWLGLSNTELAKALSAPRSSVCNWQSGHRDMPNAATMQLGQMLINKLSLDIGRDDIGIEISNNGRLHLKISARCRGCGEWYELTHSKTKHCKRCRK